MMRDSIRGGGADDDDGMAWRRNNEDVVDDVSGNDSASSDVVVVDKVAAAVVAQQDRKHASNNNNNNNDDDDDVDAVPVSNKANDNDGDKKKKKNGKGDGKDDGKSGEAAKPRVGVMQLFRFARPLDVFLMVVGALMSVVRGTTLPAFSRIFGDVIDVLYRLGPEIPEASRATEPELIDVSLRFLYFAAVAFVSSWVQVSFGGCDLCDVCVRARVCVHVWRASALVCTASAVVCRNEFRIALQRKQTCCR